MRTPSDISFSVQNALREDIGSGDVTAALVEDAQIANASVYVRQDALICGRPWVDEVFRQVCPKIALQWEIKEGQKVMADQRLLRIKGPARQILTAERSALNFLQTLSATATQTARYVEAVRHTSVRIVDTRKTIPGLRNAQKYAVVCGGGQNHRIGLYDGILIKENHIASAGGIQQAIEKARASNALVPLMTEAETLDEARIALDQNVDLLLVDEFSEAMLLQAVAMTRAHRASGGKTLIEYSGSANLQNVAAIAASGVDRISIGSLTKHLQAVDLSMRFE